MDPAPELTRTRIRLHAVGAGWWIMGLAHLGLSNYSDPVTIFAGTFAFVAGAFALTMAWRPTSRIAFRIGGTFAVGMLFLRLVTLYHFLLSSSEEGFWLSVSATGSTILLAALYGHWWLTDVGIWHQAQTLHRSSTE